MRWPAPSARTLLLSQTGHSPTVAALQAFAVDVSSALDTIETCTSDEELATLSRLVGEALAAGLALARWR